MKRFVCIIVIATAVALAIDVPDVAAQVDPGRVEQLNADGLALYASGHYRESIAKFSAAHALFPDPKLLYNIGKAYSALGELTQAIDAFRRCATSDKTPTAIRDKALKQIAELRTLRTRVDPPPPLPTSRPPSPSNSTPPKATPRPERPLLPPEENRSEESSTLSTVKWIPVFLALGATGVGTAFYVQGAADHGKLKDAKDAAGTSPVSMSQVQAQELVDDGDKKKVVGGVLLVTAGALTATAFVLFALDGPARDEATPRVSVAPSTTGASVGLVGWF